VNAALVLTTFAVVLPAELPDESMLASMVLGTRDRPLPLLALWTAAALAVLTLVEVVRG
jgi:putative Ca2+/H+ antiporter (TMEM165/GDT1 family)